MFKTEHTTQLGLKASVLLFVSLGLFSSCSEGSERLSAWPDLGNPSGLPGSTTGEAGDHNAEEDERPTEERFPDSSGESTSAEDSRDTSPGIPSSGGSMSNSTSESTEETSSSSESSDQGSSAPPKCVQTLCYETNTKGEPRGYATDHAQVIFRLRVGERIKRLARVELVEGFSEAVTTVSLRKNGQNKHGALLAKVTWSDRPRDSLGWAGTDFEEPLDIEGEQVIWVEVSPAEREFYSIAEPGENFPMWHRSSPSASWVKGPAPVMFRAYCCEE